MGIDYLHTMIRVADLDAALRFFCEGLGLEIVRRAESEKGRFTLVFLGTPDAAKNAKSLGEGGYNHVPLIELTYNWPDENGKGEVYTGGRNFGHLAYRVDDVYAVCARLMDMGYTINRPPRDGHMAFVRSPDNISIEILQRGEHLPPAEPWASMSNVGEW